MADSRVAKSIGIDEMAESITTATIRALKQEHPTLDVSKSGLAVSFRIWVGIPSERAIAAAPTAVDELASVPKP